MGFIFVCVLRDSAVIPYTLAVRFINCRAKICAARPGERRARPWIIYHTTPRTIHKSFSPKLFSHNVIHQEATGRQYTPSHHLIGEREA